MEWIIPSIFQLLIGHLGEILLQRIFCREDLKHMTKENEINLANAESDLIKFSLNTAATIVCDNRLSKDVLIYTNNTSLTRS